MNARRHIEVDHPRFNELILGRRQYDREVIRDGAGSLVRYYDRGLNMIVGQAIYDRGREPLFLISDIFEGEAS